MIMKSGRKPPSLPEMWSILIDYVFPRAQIVIKQLLPFAVYEISYAFDFAFLSQLRRFADGENNPNGNRRCGINKCGQDTSESCSDSGGAAI